MARAFVLDSMVLIFLAKTKLSECVAGSKARFFTTPLARDEVFAKKGFETPALETLFQTTVTVQSPKRPALFATISPADASLLILAKELNGALVTDDRDALSTARLHGIPAYPLAFLVFDALKRKTIRPEQALKILDDLLEHHWHIDTPTLARIQQTIRAYASRAKKQE